MFLTILWNGTCSLFSPGWIAASAITGLDWIIFITYAFKHLDRFFRRLMFLAMLAGWVELLPDRWLVEITGTLIYHSGGPFIIRSPLYMPFAWGVVLVQTGYVGWRLLEYLKKGWAILITGLLGAATIPLYEWWAKGAMWWYYKDTRMIGGVPIYIIFGEFFLACGLILLIDSLEKRPLWMIPLFGVAQGLWIWACYATGFYLIG